MRILWLKTELLHPVDKGGKIRTYQMLKHLKKDHHITYLTLDAGDAASDARELAHEYCDDLVSIDHVIDQKFSAGFYRELATNLLSRLPYAIEKYQSRGMRDEIVNRDQKREIDLLVCDFLAPAINVPNSLGCPTLLFEHNVEAMIWRRHYEVQDNPLKKTYLYWQWKKMHRFERESCRRFDTIVTVSEQDRDQIKSEFGSQNVFAVATGVDLEFFRPRNGVQTETNSLVFTGSMDWLPNEDGVRYLTEQIMPLIKSKLPNVKLTIVGRSPSERLQELGRNDPSLIVTGRVDDVRPYMQKAAAYVVPLRVGGGTRLKIFEAMAMEKPVISTTIGAEGLPVKHDSDLLLADSPKDFADSVVRVLTDVEMASRLSKQAALTVRENFGWEKAAKDFSVICERTVTAHR